MQRQSLGSPSSKLHLGMLLKDDQFIPETQKQHLPSSSTTLSNNTSLLYGRQEHEEGEELEEEEIKKLKLKPRTMPENYIHFIPMLTLLCFFILYLSSHNPSQNDLAQFNGFKRSSDPAGEDIHKKLQGIVGNKKGDIMATRSLKDLKEESLNNRRFLHPKMADF